MYIPEGKSLIESSWTSAFICSSITWLPILLKSTRCAAFSDLFARITSYNVCYTKLLRFGIPYKKQDGEPRLNLKDLGEHLSETINAWVKEYGREIEFKIEPGRYIAAECSVVLGEVHTVKENYDLKYVGTDLGFNVLIRPAMYDSHHDIEIYRPSSYNFV